MSLYKPKGSPFWHFDFVIKGQRFHGSTGRKVKDEAREVLDEERSKARLVRPDDLLLRQAFKRYWNEHAKNKKTSDDIFTKLERLIDGFGPNKRVSEVSNMDISNYIAVRKEEVSNASVNREITLLRAVLNRANTAWDIPIKGINWKAHMLIEPRGRVRSLTDDEEKRLFAVLRDDFKPLVRFCLITGARVSSVRGLTWAAVDMESMEIKLEVKSKFLGEFHILPIIPEIKALLDSVRGQHPIYVFTYLCVGKVPRKREKGQRYPFARDGWRRTWEKALKDAKIKDFRFHDLRHTAATQMLRATKDIAAVKEVLGHRDISTTMRYAHVTKDSKLSALSRNAPEKEHATERKDENNVVKLG
jgi:integrase